MSSLQIFVSIFFNKKLVPLAIDAPEIHDANDDSRLLAILGSNITSTMLLLIFFEFNLEVALSPAFLPISEGFFKSSKCVVAE